MTHPQAPSALDRAELLVHEHCLGTENDGLEVRFGREELRDALTEAFTEAERRAREAMLEAILALAQTPPQAVKGTTKLGTNSEPPSEPRSWWLARHPQMGYWMVFDHNPQNVDEPSPEVVRVVEAEPPSEPSGRPEGKERQRARLSDVATDLFHQWAALPGYEPLDEDLAITLVCRIQDALIKAENGEYRKGADWATARGKVK